MPNVFLAIILMISMMMHAMDSDRESYIYVSYINRKYQLSMHGQDHIVIDRNKLRAAAPQLVQKVETNYKRDQYGKKFIEVKKPKEIWCLLQSLESKLNHGSVSQCLVDSKVMLGAIQRSHNLGVHVLEEDNIRRLAHVLTQQDENRKTFLKVPNLFKRIIGLNRLNENDKKAINRELLLPHEHLISPALYSVVVSPQKNIYKLLFSPMNTRLVSISDECMALCVWDIENAQLIGMFKDNPLLGAQIAFSQDDVICAISRGKDIICFNTKERTINKIQTYHTYPIIVMEFEEDSYTIISKSELKGLVALTSVDHKLNFLYPSSALQKEDLDSQEMYKKRIRTMARVFNNIYSSIPAFCTLQEGYAVGTHQGTIEIVKDELKEICFADKIPVVTVAFDSSEKCIAGVMRDGTIKIYQHSLLEMISPYQALLIRYAADHYEKKQRALPIKKKSLLYQWADTMPAALYDRIYHLFEVREQREH